MHGLLRLMSLIGHENLFVTFGPQMMLAMYQSTSYAGFMLLLHSIDLEFVPKDSKKNIYIFSIILALMAPNRCNHHICLFVLL